MHLPLSDSRIPHNISIPPTILGQVRDDHWTGNGVPSFHETRGVRAGGAERQPQTGPTQVGTRGAPQEGAAWRHHDVIVAFCEVRTMAFRFLYPCGGSQSCWQKADLNRHWSAKLGGRGFDSRARSSGKGFPPPRKLQRYFPSEPVCLSICLPVLLSVYPSIHLSIHPSVRPSVCLSINLST